MANNGTGTENARMPHAPQTKRKTTAIKFKLNEIKMFWGKLLII